MYARIATYLSVHKEQSGARFALIKLDFSNLSLLVRWGCTCAVRLVNSALSPVVYGDIALSINKQYNTIIRNERYI